MTESKLTMSQSPALNLLSPAVNAVRTVVGIQIHAANAVIEHFTSCKSKHKDEPNGDNIYDLADSMLDLSTLIYPYSFLRRAFSNQVKELLTKVKLTEEQVEPLKVALAKMKIDLDRLHETGVGADEFSDRAFEYSKSITEVNELKQRLGLQGGDIEIFKKYYDVLAPGKTVSEIKADLTVYADAIALQLKLFGSEEFNVESAQSLVENDENAVFTYIDDDSLVDLD